MKIILIEDDGSTHVFIKQEENSKIKAKYTPRAKTVKKVQKTTCDICGKIVTKRGLKMHNTIAHETEQKMLSCDLCGKMFRGYIGLGTHKSKCDKIHKKTVV